MATAFRHGAHYSYAQYLDLEATSNVRHEYLDGQIYAMAGGAPEHAALQAATIVLLFAQLDGTPCRAHSSDLHVRVLATGLGTSPDAWSQAIVHEGASASLSAIGASLDVRQLYARASEPV